MHGATVKTLEAVWLRINDTCEGEEIQEDLHCW